MFDFSLSGSEGGNRTVSAFGVGYIEIPEK
jgi:hypothetical protein